MLIALFSQYISKFEIPVPGYSKDRGGCHVYHFPLFRLFPVSFYSIIAALSIWFMVPNRNTISQ